MLASSLRLSLVIAAISTLGHASYLVLNITAPVVTANEDFTVLVNFTDSSWRWECSASWDTHGCNWPFFRVTVETDTRYWRREAEKPENGITLLAHYCYIEGCVGTNLTSFNTSIPATTFPADGYPYALAYTLFRQTTNGSIEQWYPTFAGLDSNFFNISGATAAWTAPELKSRWYPLERYAHNLPCEAVPCARECFIKSPNEWPYRLGRQWDELDECVKACPGFGWDATKDCIVKNAIEPPANTTNSTSGPDSTTPTSSPTPTSEADRFLTMGTKTIFWLGIAWCALHVFE